MFRNLRYFVNRYFAMKKIELDYSRESRTKEAVIKEARYCTQYCF